MVDRFVRSNHGAGAPKGAPIPDEGAYLVNSGCSGLNLAVANKIGGAWPGGRIINIVGDKSTGKTLLAMEAMTNFGKQFSDGLIWYRDAESAFNEEYAYNMGVPLDRVDMLKKDDAFNTVEHFFADLKACCAQARKARVPGIYVIDSLDALSDEAEMEREIDAKSYGGTKSKKMSELLRRLVRDIEKAKVCLIIISQVRANIGAMFGRKTTRSGGKALDFYASIIVYLAHLKTLEKTRKGFKRAVGVRVKAKCDKNKIGRPFQEFTFSIMFNYGVEDLSACLEWLLEAKQTKVAGLTQKEAEDVIHDAQLLDAKEYVAYLKDARAALKKVWNEVEDSFKPARRKYD